jgi:FkbM family methyltransferase
MPVVEPRPSRFRRLLNRWINPHRLNDSALYGLYLKLRHPQHLQQKRLERAFYERLIAANGGGTVFDIGANCGQKAVQFRACARRVICVEPDPTAVEQLRARLGHRDDVVIVPAGVGDEAGQATFYQLSPASPLNTFSRQWSDAQAATASETSVAIVTLDQLIASHGLPSYIKIDVEGYELQVLQGLHQPIRALSFECNLQQFRRQTLDCIARLAALQPGLFNHCLSEPPSRFASDRWLTAAEMTAIVAGADHDYAEIYFQASDIS